MVNVTKSSTQEMWRMEYKGSVDYLDEAPTPDEKRLFMQMVDQRMRRDSVVLNPPPDGHNQTQVTRV